MRRGDLSDPRLVPQDTMRGLWGSGSWLTGRLGTREKRGTQDGPIPLSSVGRIGSKADAGSALPSPVGRG